jgi:hypothetical protein
MLNTTLSSTPNGDALTNVLSVLYLCTVAAGILTVGLYPLLQNPCEIQTPDPVWKIVDVINGETLYERTYPSGKKAWRYRSGNVYVYPRRSELAIFGILK